MPYAASLYEWIACCEQASVRAVVNWPIFLSVYAEAVSCFDIYLSFQIIYIQKANKSKSYFLLIAQMIV